MRLQLLKNEYMALTGSYVLRSLQNETMPIIDLVIRESFQNSLDATLKDEDRTEISVHTQKINTKDISPVFGGITDTLNERFKENRTVLTISDKKTSGLRGAINPQTKEELSSSNIYKLIYSLGRNQDEAGAGGSWGLGKTSFFRIGVGIVLYYTRVLKDNGEYGERLAGSLVEDENDNKNSLVNNNDLGIAWWGETDTDDEVDRFTKTYPLTNQEEIKTILQAFKITPYTGTETGTTIVIPFIDEDKITASATTEKGNGNDEYSTVFPWEKSLDNSIEMAIQRWYGSRIINPIYNKKVGNSDLQVSVNGKQLTMLNYEKVFEWFYLLYNHALIGKSTQDKIEVQPIYLPRMGLKDNKEAVGHLAFASLSKEDLDMSGPDKSLSPLAYIGHKGSKTNDNKTAKILAYTRKPAMTIQYVVDDSEWLRNVPTPEDKFILAFFVPNSSAVLHDRYQKDYHTLEDYLRDTETADHASWEDKQHLQSSPITIVRRIRGEVSKILREKFDETVGANYSRTSALSRMFGQMLLPAVNFGRSAIRGSNTNQNPRDGELPGNQTTMKNGTIKVSSVNQVSDTELEIRFILGAGKNTVNKVSLEVITEDKILTRQAWFKTFEDSVSFPFEITELTMDKLANRPFELEDLSELDISYHQVVGEDSAFIVTNGYTKSMMFEGRITVKVSNTLTKMKLSVQSSVRGG